MLNIVKATLVAIFSLAALLAQPLMASAETYYAIAAGEHGVGSAAASSGAAAKKRALDACKGANSGKKCAGHAWTTSAHYAAVIRCTVSSSIVATNGAWSKVSVADAEGKAMRELANLATSAGYSVSPTKCRRVISLAKGRVKK